MHIFEYSGITEGIPSDIAETIAKIESIRALDPIRRRVYSKELHIAESACIDDSIRSSLFLEGILMTDPDGTDSCQYTGLRDTWMDSVSTASDVDETGLISLHKRITNGYTRRDSRFRLRDRDDRDEHVHNIRPSPAREIESSVEQMNASYRMARDVGIQPILLIPNMVLDLLNIRPFQEANWRISRMLLTSLLIAGGYDSLRISSLERHLADNREDYYDSVAESSSGWTNNDSDPFPFIRFITGMILECYDETAARYPLDDGLKVKKNERIARIVEWNREPISKSEICRLLPDVSIRTADVVLTGLVSEGRLQKIGTYRNARYAPAEI